MQGLLVRVSIDKSCGEWNAPCRWRDGCYVYVPIPEHKPVTRVRSYEEVSPAVREFGVELPQHLHSMHLDPDFEQMTFGDQGQRGSLIDTLRTGDFLLFWGGFQPLDNCPHRLVYAAFGIMFVERIVPARMLAGQNINAHTRRREIAHHEIVVFGDSRTSGRFDRLLPIGEWRNRAYRLTPAIMKSWGGIDVNDGYIQRSAKLPVLQKPERVLRWLKGQRVTLQSSNW